VERVRLVLRVPGALVRRQLEREQLEPGQLGPGQLEPEQAAPVFERSASAPEHSVQQPEQAAEH